MRVPWRARAGRKGEFSKRFFSWMPSETFKYPSWGNCFDSAEWKSENKTLPLSFDYNNPTYRIKGTISDSIFDTPALGTPLFRPWTMMPPLLLPPPPFSVLQYAVITRCASSVVSSWSPCLLTWSPCLGSHLGSMVLQSSVSHLALYSSYTSLFSWSGSPIGQVMLPSLWLQQPPGNGNKV